MGKVALLAEREDGAAQSSKQSQGLCTLSGHCWEGSQFVLRAMGLWDRSCGTHSKLCRSQGAKRQGGCCPPQSWKLLPVLAEPSLFCLEVSLSSLGLLPLLSTEDPAFHCFPQRTLPEGRTCLALIVHLPVEVPGVYSSCVCLSWGAQGRRDWSMVTPHIPGLQVSCHGS